MFIVIHDQGLVPEGLYHHASQAAPLSIVLKSVWLRSITNALDIPKGNAERAFPNLDVLLWYPQLNFILQGQNVIQNKVDKCNLIVQFVFL